VIVGKAFSVCVCVCVLVICVKFELGCVWLAMLCLDNYRRAGERMWGGGGRGLKLMISWPS
jgi:hypothetical protein